MKIWLSLFALLLGLFSIENSLSGQEFLKDILTKSPGPLHKYHQEWDSIQGCISCHVNRLGGDIADNKCMDCHPDIKERIDKNIGFHSGKTECHTCHGDHKGRDGFIFAPKDWLKTFDHSDTQYELIGGHKKPECRDCHTEMRQHFKTKNPTTTESYLGAPTTCYDCHQNMYEHRFSKEDWLNCTECHSSGLENWKKMAKRMTFNHSKTDYPLEGLHKPVACTDCHQPDAERRRITTFAPLSFNDCRDCHYDVHEGKFGDNCQSCHSVYREWTNLSQAKDPKSATKLKDFDHSKTKFPLLGYHQATPCESCHTNPASNFKISKDKFDECSDCHGFAHGVQFANEKCESCHIMENKFQESTFTLERHNKSKFPLTGKHQVMDCSKCHWNGQFENIPSDKCESCHQNVHDQRQIDKECSFCHVTTSFAWIQFDHNRNTDFRLTGKHRDVACVSCHVDQVFKDMPANNDNPNCQSCHADPHGAKVEDDCQSCHITEGFKLAQNFDHQKLFGWGLEGRHSELSCQKCHSNHLKADYAVPLAGKNLRAAACSNCHVDAHAGKYGPSCESCHNVQSFTVQFGEKVHELGYFKLQGYHDQMACAECHRPETNLQGLGVQCNTCHEKTDIHLGKMGPECGDCHTQTAWLPTTFKHNTTGFRLSGAHRYVECSSCHVNQIYQGLPADCYFCHSDSHLAGIGQHSVGSIQECADCHTSLSWKIRRGGGIQ